MRFIDTPFAVINADDYYGKTSYKLVHDYLVSETKDFCMAGFVLKNTLSDHGGVTRGICQMKNGYLTDIVETHNIIKTTSSAEVEGKNIDIESLVSMNMWGLTLKFMDSLEEGFKRFFQTTVPNNPLKSEFLIPIYIGELLKENKVNVKVLKTTDTWYGMTYKEDVVAVQESFRKLIEDGVYREDLYSDL